jgi:hypothetical protein
MRSYTFATHDKTAHGIKPNGGFADASEDRLNQGDICPGHSVASRLSALQAVLPALKIARR